MEQINREKIKEFIYNNISKFNNVRLLDPLYDEVKDVAQKELSNFIIEYFEEYNLKLKNSYEIIKFPNNDDFYDLFREFYKVFKEELDSQKQSDRERSKFINHDGIYNHLFDKIGFLHDLINS